MLRELIERAIRVKADVVAADLRETAATAVRPRGAQLRAHARRTRSRRAERYRFRHGAAVAIGMVFVAELARLAGRLDDATADRHRSVLRSRRPADDLPRRAWATLLDAMKVDKKSRGDRCASWSSTAWPGPASSRAPTRPCYRAFARSRRRRSARLDPDGA